MKSIYLAGEDDVTKACLKKIVLNYAPQTQIITELPARGGQLKSLITNFNRLAEDNPVLLLMDLDNNNCAPHLKEESFKGLTQSNNFIFNIACDEAESWLMADIKTFSDYFKVPVGLIPAPKNIGSILRPYKELDFKYKSSLFLVMELIIHSTDSTFIKMMVPKKGASKGPEYNRAILPFIENHWNIEHARTNSESLDRAVKRIANFL